MSEHAHSSIDKGAIAVGIGRENLRHVAADRDFRMIPQALAAAIESDIAAGHKPFCVVPTIGTTASTSADPLSEILPIARKHGLWVHVDAAYGGPAALLAEHRHWFNGIEQADSIVLNPHKWLFTPVYLSILYCRRPEIMRRALALEEIPAYLQVAQHERAVNYSDYVGAAGPAVPIAEVVVRAALLRPRRDRESAARAHSPGATAGEMDSRGSSIRSVRAGTVFAGVFSVQGIGRGQQSAVRENQRKRQGVSIEHGVAWAVCVALGDREYADNGAGCSGDVGVDQIAGLVGELATVSAFRSTLKSVVTPCTGPFRRPRRKEINLVLQEKYRIGLEVERT